MSCRSRHRLPDAWVKMVIDQVDLGRPNWANYNSDRAYYEKLKFVANDQHGILCKEDLPSQPDPNDYPDTDGAAFAPEFKYSGTYRDL